MCGICGIVDYAAAPDRELLGRMASAMAHRGPDDEGFELLGAAGLGFRRLSIIDLAGSHQPLCNEDESIWLVFNGEIYNYRDLRKQLEARGHRFRTAGDGETIVHLYEEYGDDFVQHLNGMFGIGLWDTRRERLVLARDRMGIKPVYYAQTPHGLLFASETKSILQSPAVDRTLDTSAIAGYMNYSSVPGEQSFFRGVRKLLPGHVAVFDRSGVQTQRYWDVDFSQKTERSLDDTLDGIESTLRDSVKLRMISDVPFGAFLSGGVDSSLVAALMAQESSQPVEAFSIGYGDETAFIDEVRWAARVAAHYGMRHHKVIVDPNDLLADLDDVVWHLDEPCGDPAAFLTLALSRFSRQHVTVSLSGLGGDELFAGYRQYIAVRWQDRYLRIPKVIRNGLIRPTVRMLPVARTTRLGNYARLARKFVDAADEDLRTFWANRVSFLPVYDKPIFTGDMRQALRTSFAAEAFDDYWSRTAEFSPVDRLSYMDMKMFMVDQLLMLQDKMSMAVSLEARVPMLDHRLVEFAASIPDGDKLEGGKLKFLLKRVAERHVPRECIYREKQGFAAPVETWLKGPLRERVHDVLNPQHVRERGLFEPEFTEWLKRRFYDDGQDYSVQLYQLLLLETWLTLYVDDHAPVAAS